MGDEVARERSASGGEPPPLAGCLSRDQLLALQAMPPGQMPGEIAAHLASCERCQRQALFGAAQAALVPAKQAPTLGRALLRVGIILVALAMVLASIRLLVG